MDRPLKQADFVASIEKTFGNRPVTHYPKKPLDRLVFLGSVAFSLDPNRSYSEGEINTALGSWLKDRESLAAIDHVTLRRYLIDVGFLTRIKDGSAYSIDEAALENAMPLSLRELSITDIVSQAEEEREARRLAWEADRDAT